MSQYDNLEDRVRECAGTVGAFFEIMAEASDAINEDRDAEAYKARLLQYILNYPQYKLRSIAALFKHIDHTCGGF